MPETDPVISTSKLHAIGWGAFLACSWTWCIGMFLPVLLVRDYGFWAWVVFAIPNVIGAALMAWVLRDSMASRRFVEKHAAACAAFSWVTIAFHLFFAAWILTRFGNGASMPIALLATTAVCWVGVVQQRNALIASVLIFCASVALLLMSPLHAPQIQKPPMDVAYLAVPCLFGFALCPYLDLTFHRARQSTSPTGGRAAFGIGFGAMFLAMIVFTLLYYPTMLGILENRRAAPTLLGVHLVLQSGFTIAAHLHQLAARALRMTKITVPGVILCAAAIGLGFAPIVYRELEDGEVVYRCFMAFYGLIFPAYLWICGWPISRGALPTNQRLITLVVALIVAGPMFWIGFIEGGMVWAVPGVVVVLVAGIVLRQRSPDGRTVTHR